MKKVKFRLRYGGFTKRKNFIKKLVSSLRSLSIPMRIEV